LREEFEKAEDAYRAASELECEPHPGPLLRLAQGRVEEACMAIRRLTNATSDRLRRARLLPAHLDIMLAVGDLEDARSARDELRALAQAFDTDVLRAVVAQADGKPGKVRHMVEKFQSMSTVLIEMGQKPLRVLTDVSGEPFRTVIAQAKVEKVEDFFALEQRLMTNETLRKTMADYHELVDRGRREIYRIEI
jgi:hypothetical protein